MTTEATPAAVTPPPAATGTPATPSTPAAGTPAPEKTVSTPATPATPAAPAAATPAKPGEEGKPAETPPGTPAVPAKYELKLPDGTLLPTAHLEKIAAEARELGLSNEGAQKMVERDARIIADHHARMTEQYSQNLEAAIVKKNQEWIEQVKADPEIGGDNVNQSVELAKRAFKSLVGNDKEILAFVEGDGKTAPGLGNHPGFIRMFTKIGKLIGEDSLVISTAQGGGKKAIEDVFYPAKKAE